MSIWKYKEIKNTISTEEILTLNEGETGLEELKDDKTKLMIKREDLNPSGSWKDRGTAYKITQLKRDGIREAVLFSSGNAVISFLHYTKLYPEFKLHIVLSDGVNEKKRDLIQSLIQATNHQIHISPEPKMMAIRLAADNKIPNLRVSIDNDIVKGYWSLGFELGDELRGSTNQNSAIFCPASSGTALVGMTEGLFMKQTAEFNMPRIYVCQTESVHTFMQTGVNKEGSLADAIVDTVGLRAPQIQKIVKETNGEVLIITNDELRMTNESLLNEDLDLSYNSLLSLAGYLRLRNNGKLEGVEKVVCVASGR